MTQEYNLLQSLMDNIPDFIYFKDKKNRFIKVNKAKAEHSGTTAEEMSGKTDFDFFPEEEAKKCFADDNRVMEIGKPLINRIEEITLSDGRKRWISATKIPRYNEKGEVIGTMGISRDITEQKRAEEKLKHAAAELVRTNEELEQFAHTVSHDLKEPVRGIETFSKFLLEDYSDKIDDEGRDYLKRIMVGAVRMRNLIDDLLALSRISRIKGTYELVDSQKLVSKVVKELELLIEEKNVKVEIDEELPFFHGDPIKMKEVFYNLITNAIKYNDKLKPEIEINAKKDAEKVTFFVRDNGIGIKKEYFKVIFQIFRRLHGREEYGGGTGAGLAIVKKIIDEHKGKIWVESEVGKGTTFYFTVPKKINNDGKEV